MRDMGVPAYLVEMAIVYKEALVVRNRNNARAAGDQLRGVIGRRLGDRVWKFATETESIEDVIQQEKDSPPRIEGAIQDISDRVASFLTLQTTPHLVHES